MRSVKREEQAKVECVRGLDQSFDDYGAPLGTFRACTNMRIRANGRLEKRAGTYAPTITTAEATNRITGSSSFLVDHPGWLASVGGAPALGVTSGKVFAYRKPVGSEASDRFTFQGCYSTCTPVREREGMMGTPTAMGAACINATGYVLVANANPITGNTVRLVLSGPDGQQYWSGSRSATRVRIVPCGASGNRGDFVAVYQVGSDIRAQRININSPPDTSDASIGTLVSSSAYWDVSAFDSDTLYLIYQNGASQVTVANVSVAGASSAPAVVDTVAFAVTGTCPVSVFADPISSLVWVSWYNNPTVSGDVRANAFDLALTSAQFSTATIASAADVYGPLLMGHYRDYQSGGPSSTAIMYAFRNVRSSAPLTCSTRIGTIATDGTTSGPRDIWGVLPISKPDGYNRLWGLVTTTSANQSVQRAVLMRIHSADDAGTNGTGDDNGVTVELSGPNFPNYDSYSTDGPAGRADFFQNPSSSTLFDANAEAQRSVFAVPTLIGRDATSSLCHLAVYEYETGEQQHHAETLPVGNTTYVAGQPTAAWGDPSVQGNTSEAGCAEVGYAQTPVITSATAATGGSMELGTRTYRVVWEWADIFGNRHLSAPSPPVAVTLSGSNNAVTLVYTQPTLGQRPYGSPGAANRPAAVLIYRTTAGGAVHHAVARDNGGTSNGTQTFTDTLADSSIRDEEVLYTEGGVQQNDLAPSCRFMAKSEDRLWLGGLWNPRLIQCSKVMVPQEPPLFSDSPAFQVFLPDDVTGLAYQDGQIIVFCAQSIYLVSGDGPNDQGFGAFPSPRGYSQDIGCSADDYKSIVQTARGVIFKGPTGFYLIPRGFGPLVPLPQIRDELESNGLTKVYAAAVHGGTLSAERYGGHLARWLVGTPSSTYATDVLTFDVDNGQWFKDSFEDAEPGGRMAEMGAWPDGFAFMSSNLNADSNSAPIWYESGAYVGDASDAYYVTQRLQTARYQPFGPLGYGHVKRVMVGVKAAPTLACQLTLNVQLDDNTAQSATWTIPTGGLPQYRELPLASPQTCSTLRISIEDSALNGVPAPGVKLIALAFEADDSGGLRQLDISERA